jgi:hypothetical protein
MTDKGEKHFSWIEKSNQAIVKTADKSLLDYATTGVPQSIASFFTGRNLNENERIDLKVYVEGEGKTIKLKHVRGRHILSLSNLRKTLKLDKLTIGRDCVWFEYANELQNSFILATTCSVPKYCIIPKAISKPSKTSTKLIVNSRIGQDYFRASVAEKCGNKCVVTGVNEQTPGVLIASHIKPWAKSNDDEKMDGNNGLLLSPHVDKLFDKGLITFTDGGKLVASGDLSKSVLGTWGVNAVKRYVLNEEQKIYMKYHREEVFRA